MSCSSAMCDSYSYLWRVMSRQANSAYLERSPSPLQCCYKNTTVPRVTFDSSSLRVLSPTKSSWCSVCRLNKDGETFPDELVAKIIMRCRIPWPRRHYDNCATDCLVGLHPEHLSKEGLKMEAQDVFHSPGLLKHVSWQLNNLITLVNTTMRWHGSRDRRS